ncbi:MAG: hypothetical protein ACOYK1_03400 [Vampirovibrionia bacterium]
MKGDSIVLEQDFIDIFSKYNLYDALSCFSRMSCYISYDGDERNINRFAYIDDKYQISQAILAYFTNMILISASNEYKAKQISQEAQRIFKLASDYSNKLAEFPDDFDSLDESQQLRIMFIRLYYEQTRWQLDRRWTFSRAILIYEKLLESYDCKEIAEGKLAKVCEASPVELFKKETGLTIKEYFISSYLLMSLDPHKELIRSNMGFSDDLKKINPETYREDKLQKYLDLLSCDYQYFKDLDKKMNENYKGLSRLRFNPLSIYPVIKTQKKYLKRDSIYIIPNYNLFSLKVTEGLFWFFIDYYSRKDKENGIKNGAKKGAEAAFRGAFGEAFKRYVGILLKEIYNGAVHDADAPDAIKVDSKPLGDWYIDSDDKFYIIEIKARRYNRLAQTLDIKALDKELNDFIKNAAQVYGAVNKIKNTNDKALDFLKKKQIIPILINYEVPYLGSRNMLEEKGFKTNAINEKFKENGMGEAELYYSDIYGLEIYLDVLKAKEANLEDVLMRAGEEKPTEATYLNVDSGDFLDIARIKNKSRTGNSFLDQIHKNFWDESLGRA